MKSMYHGIITNKMIQQLLVFRKAMCPMGYKYGFFSLIKNIIIVIEINLLIEIHF